MFSNFLRDVRSKTRSVASQHIAIDGEEILILRVAMTENTDVRFVTATFSSLLDGIDFGECSVSKYY